MAKIDIARIKALSTPKLKKELMQCVDPIYIEYVEEITKELKLRQARKITDAVETVCDKFCKYSGSGANNECVWSLTHEGQCPFDEIMKEVGK